MPDTQTLITFLAAASIITFVATLLLVPFILTRLPADYFTRDTREPLPTFRAHPAIRWTLRILKNILALILLTGGLIMLITPGQGILSILIALSLLDFPGKYTLERALVRKRPVHRSINWIRTKAHKPPIHIPPDPNTP